MTSAIDLVERLVRIADTLVENRGMQIGNDALRALRDEVGRARMQLSETDFAVDYEAACLIDCVAALAYARSASDRAAEERAAMYINTLRVFLRQDVLAVRRRMGA